jgi:hypothetical protein
MATNEVEAKLTKFITTWTQKYRFIVKSVPPQPGKENAPQQCFVAEFSQPSPATPISHCSLKVFFFLPADSTDISEVSFRFEHDELLHKINSTIKYEDMEKFLEMHMNYRGKTRQTYFLATNFEKTRIVDTRIALLPEKQEVKEEVREAFEVKKPQLFQSQKIMPQIHKNSIEASNLALLTELDRQIVDAFGFGLSNFLSVTEIYRFLRLFGLKTDASSIWRGELAAQPTTGEGFIDLATLRPFIKELAFSKLLFEIILWQSAEAIRTAQTQAVELLKKRFFIIFDEVQHILHSIIQNNNININSVKQLLKGLSEKFLTAKEVATIENRYANELLTPDLMKSLKQAICEVKVAGFVRQYLKVKERPIHKQFLEELEKKELKSLSKEQFEAFFKENESVLFVRRQIEFLWSFLESRGRLVDGELPVDEWFIVVTRYTHFMVELKPLVDRFLGEKETEAENKLVFPDQSLQDRVFQIMKAESAEALRKQMKSMLKYFAFPEGDLTSEFQELKTLATQTDVRVEDGGAVKALILDHAFQIVTEHFLVI